MYISLSFTLLDGRSVFIHERAGEVTSNEREKSSCVESKFVNVLSQI